MKRIIALFLMLCFAAGLLGCGGGPAEAPDNTEQAAVTDSAAPANTESAQNTEAADAGEKFYCFDYRCACGSGGVQMAAETDDTVYFLLDHFMYFSDKDYKEWMPLCPRPDCDHKSANCNAYLKSICGFFIYGNYIWYIEDLRPEDPQVGETVSRNYTEPALCRMRLDGTQHERVVRLPVPETSFKTYENDWSAFNSGKYVIVKYRAFKNERRLEDEKHYYVYDMETGEHTTIEFNIPYDLDLLIGITPLYGDGDMLYCAGECRPEEFDDSDDAEDVGFEGFKRFIGVLDLKTGSFGFIGDVPVSVFYPEGGFGLIDGEFYYTTWDGEGPLGIYAMDVVTGESRLVKEEGIKDFKYTSFDWSNNTWFTSYYKMQEEFAEITRPYWGLYVFNSDFEQLEYWPYDDETAEEAKKLGWIIQTESYVLYSNRRGDEVPLWYFEKADVGTGSLALHRWEP